MFSGEWAPVVYCPAGGLLIYLVSREYVKNTDYIPVQEFILRILDVLTLAHCNTGTLNCNLQMYTFLVILAMGWVCLASEVQALVCLFFFKFSW